VVLLPSFQANLSTLSINAPYKNSNLASFDVADTFFLPAKSLNSNLGISPFGLFSV
jgi:hypothetical protein